MKNNPKNQQAEKRCNCLKAEIKDYISTNCPIHCKPSEEKDTLPKIKPKKIDIKKLEGIVERYNSEEKDTNLPVSNVSKKDVNKPSEEKDTLPKIKPKKIDIKKLEGIVERYNSEEKVCDCATPGIHKCCPVHAPTEAGWDAKEWYSQLFDTDRDLYGKVKGLIAQVIKEEREKLKQLILESMPEKINSVNKFYGKSEIEWGFENTYNKAIDDVTKVIEDIFDGRE